MGTVNILGRTYQTAILVDGTERLSENFAYVSGDIGRFWNDGETDNGRGAYYTPAELFILDGMLPDGWRVERYETDTAGLLSALEATYPSEPDRAAYLLTGPFNLTPVGYWNADFGWNDTDQQPFPALWVMGSNKAHSYIWAVIDGSVFSWEDGFLPIDRRSVRLVRGPLPDVATPVLLPSSGYSAGPVTVTATCATAGATAHYTIDGSTPTESSPILNGGIVLGSWVSPAITLKVMASASGHNSSGVVSATYQFTAQAPMISLQMQPESGYFFSEAESRKPRASGACGKGIFKGTLQWELLDAEWPLYLEWREAKQKGVQPFDIFCCTGDHAALHTFQAVGTPSIVRETGLRKVSIPVKLTNRPTVLAAGWGGALVGPPAAYPPLVPMPQWGYRREEAALYLSTSGAPTVARPVATRGELLSLEWKALSGSQFDMLVDWWATYLGHGRRKFYLSLPDSGDTLLCQLVEDPSFTVEGVHFQGSMQVFAAAIHTLAPLPT